MNLQTQAVQHTSVSTAHSHSVQEIYEHARNHVFYRELLQRSQSFADAPYITKDQLIPKIRTLEADPEAHSGVYWSPSGSTTRNVTFFFPTALEENVLQRQIFSDWLKRAQLITAERMALNCFGASEMTRACEIFNTYCTNNGATVLPVTSMASLDFTADIARRFRPDIIMGAVPRLIALASHCQQQRQPLHIEQVLFAGQPLQAGESRYLLEAFSARQISGLFGSAEGGVWGFGLPDLFPQTYLGPRELVHLELDKPDSLGIGTLVLTNLIRWRYPLHRFWTGDQGTLEQEAGLWRFTFSHRVEDEFYIQDRRFSPADIRPLTQEAFGWQVVLRGPHRETTDRAVLRVGLPPWQLDRDTLEERWRLLIGESSSHTRASVEYVSSYDKLRFASWSGKLKALVDERGSTS